MVGFIGGQSNASGNGKIYTRVADDVYRVGFTSDSKFTQKTNDRRI